MICDMSNMNTQPDASMINFLEYLEVERNVSQLTIRNYGHYLRIFCDWFKRQGFNDIKQLDSDVLRKYRVYLSQKTDELDRSLSKRTQSYYVIALRSWLRWLTKNDISVLSPDVIDLPKNDAHSMKFANLENMNKLLAAPDIDTLAGRRDRAILEVLFSTGLRVSELVKLNREQVDIGRGEFGVIGKGQHPRVVFLSPSAKHYLQLYLNSREDNWSPLFIRQRIVIKKSLPSPTGEEFRLTARSVERIVDKYCRRAHMPIKLSPHSIRHSFATDLISNGAGLREVQELLGHKNIVTTQIYTHVTRPDLKKTYQKFHAQADDEDFATSQD